MRKLPLLELLSISGMEKVKSVGLEFLGRVETKEEDGSSKSSFVSFQRLEELCFEKMPQWTEWEGGAIATKTSQIITCLRSVCLFDCQSVKVLLDFLPFAQLEGVYIYRCWILRQCNKTGRGNGWDKISHIKWFDIDSETESEEESSSTDEEAPQISVSSSSGNSFNLTCIYIYLYIFWL